MRNSRVNFLVKIPIRCWDINKRRQGITFICCTLYIGIQAVTVTGPINCNTELAVFFSLVRTLSIASTEHAYKVRHKSKVLMAIFSNRSEFW